MTNNLEIWNKNESTPAEVISPIPGGANLHSINSAYQIKQFTEQFGPKGKGWGVEEEEFNFQQFGEDSYTTIIIYRAKLWYVIDNERYSFPISADRRVFEYRRKTQAYEQITNLHKSVSTDALTKGFTHLGFNMDIPLGTNAHTGKKTSSNSQKPWLNKGTDEWDQIVDKLSNGKVGIDYILNKRKVNSKDLEELKLISNAVAQ